MLILSACYITYKKFSLNQRFGASFIADKNGNMPAMVPDQQPQGRPEKRGCCQRCLMVCGVITLAVMFAAVGGGVLYNNYSPFEMYLNKVVGDFTYPVLRMWRHIVLPLHHYVDIQPYSMAECLISNPWFIPGMLYRSGWFRVY